jgi:phosphatidylserine decarboxylase
VCRGDEWGYFGFGGSTVLLVFEPGKVAFDADLRANSARPLETLIRVGQRIGVAR